jgi:nucleoid-associated protein YgaU
MASQPVASSMGKLEKACMRVVDGEVSVTELRFMFNPSEYTVSKSAKWTRPTTSSAKSATKPEFGGANPQAVSMEIFFDDFEAKGDVAARVQTLLDWTKPTTVSVNKKQPSPPILVFEWGANPALAGFRGYLKTVTAKYTLFKPDGTPLRATAQIAMEEVPTEPQGQNPTSGSIDSRRSHVLGDGDSLHSVAYREYGDPTLWRSLASYNQIDDPMRLRAGTRIFIPSAAEAARMR